MSYEPADEQTQNRSNYPQYQPFTPRQQPPTSFQPSYQPPPAYAAVPQSPNNLGSLHRDIEALIAAARTEFAAAPWEPAIQQRLKALLDLQTIVMNQQLPPDQIQLIQTQVAQLSNPQKLAIPAPAPAPPPAPAPMPTLAGPPIPQQPNLQALFSSNALAGLLASAAKAQQPPSTPPVHQVQLPQTQLPPSQPLINPPPLPTGGENPLIASLRAAGMLPPTTTPPTNGAVSAVPGSFVYPSLPTMLQTPPISSITLPPSFPKKQNDVQLTSASLKM
jgi:pre-mRNA cleavage complex 2 protein Pcf11